MGLHAHRLLLATAAMAACGAAAAESAPAALRGSVSEFGAGAAGVTISATCLASGVVTRTTSGADGSFVLDALAPCAYWVEASGAEATRAAQRITLRAGADAALRLALYSQGPLQPMVVVGLRDGRTAEVHSDVTVVQIDPPDDQASAKTTDVAAAPAPAPPPEPPARAAAAAPPARVAARAPERAAPARAPVAWRDPRQVDQRAVVSAVWRSGARPQPKRPRVPATTERLRWFVGVDGRAADPARAAPYVAVDASALGMPLLGSIAWSPGEGTLPVLNLDSRATGNLIELIGTFRVGLAYAW